MYWLKSENSHLAAPFKGDAGGAVTTAASSAAGDHLAARLDVLAHQFGPRLREAVDPVLWGEYVVNGFRHFPAVPEVPVGLIAQHVLTRQITHDQGRIVFGDDGLDGVQAGRIEAADHTGDQAQVFHNISSRCGCFFWFACIIHREAQS